MSKKQSKSQASSSKAFSQALSSTSFGTPDVSNSSSFETASSSLSYLAENPDLSSLQDSGIVVQFKNLGKKDSTTKAKALEELQNILTSLKENEKEIDESLLLAWVKVYPRISIDNSRRVRQLSHLVHGQVCLQSGKRVAKYMPSVIGAWFAGSHDPDRIVVRAAAESFNLIFPSTEKRAALSKVYQASILQFCDDAILKQSPGTLSDERTTTKENSEAKYFRVVSSNVLSLCHLAEHLSGDEIQKHADTYKDLFNSKKLWMFQGSKDSAVRRSIFKLLRSYLHYQRELLLPFLEVVCRSLFSEAVLKRQIATASDYAIALLAISTADPSIWTHDLKSPLERLEKFSLLLKFGSRGGSDVFWKTIGDVFLRMPNEALPHEYQPANEILGALRDGINAKDELRANAEQAWLTYIQLLNRLAALLTTEDRELLVTECALPLLQQYLNPMAERAQWTIQGPQAAQVIHKLLQVEFILPLTETTWPSLSQVLLDKIKTSAPEQSREYKSSQDSISVMAKKWFGLQAQILNGGFPENFKSIVLDTSETVAVESVKLLESRIGKPYGVADALFLAISNLKPFLLDRQTFTVVMDDFISTQVPALIFSNSRSQLVSILYECRQSGKYTTSWKATLDSILNSDNMVEKQSSLETFLKFAQTESDIELAITSSNLQSFFRQLADQAIDGNGDWDLLATFYLSRPSPVAKETLDHILSEILKSLTITPKASKSLAGLEAISRHNPQQSREFFQSEAGSELRQRVLFLTESEDESLAKRATVLNDQIGTASIEGLNGVNSKESTLQIIQNGLSQANSSSLSVDTLCDLALQYLKATGDLSGNMAMNLLPNIGVWALQLEPFLDHPLPPSLSTSITLGGVIHVLEDSKTQRRSMKSITYDRSGYSSTLRIFMYTLRMLEETDLIGKLSREDSAEIFRLQLLSSQLINDKLTVVSGNELWSLQDLISEENMVELVSRSGKLFNSWLQQSNEQVLDVEEASPSTALQILQSKLWSNSLELSWTSLHHARSYVYIVTQLIDLQGWNSKSETALEGRFRELRQSQAFLPLCAFVSAFKGPLANAKYYERVCNELVANLTGTKLDAKSQPAYEQLVLLNVMLEDEDHIIEAIAKQRLIFFVKQLSAWLFDGQAEVSLKIQICTVFRIVLPAIRDIYGEYWSNTVEFLSQVSVATQLSGTNIAFGSEIPLYNASLRLLATLNSLARDEDTNDDLKDALNESGDVLLKEMLTLLKRLSVIPDSSNQPLQTVNELLGRQIERMPLGNIDDFEDLYPLIAAESLATQRCAFEIIHKQIPKQQEQISVDVALEKTNARLPEELLSLVIEGPSVESLSDSDFSRTMPLSIRSYLSAWILIFDHFKGSSDKVRSDYMANLKEGDFLSKLLEFIFDFLGHSRGKPIDASKFDATVYSFDIEESPVRDIQWLLTHLYYLSLKRVSVLVKAWLADCKSRQTVTTVEPWTEKYISPSLITDALSAVEEWAKTQDTLSDDSVMIKTSPRAKEVVVSKEVDDQVMSMVIRLPNNFPLGQVQVQGVNRIAIDDKKWQTFLRNSQGVITFSNNSIIDGIIAFRRNVVGALKGQTECAICYAIVGSDKQLPTKKCATCHKLFHGSCLFRWFNTSGGTTCPLCRNPFNYTERR